MDADGQALVLLTVDDAGAEDRIPAFMPNGRDVVFSSNREDNGETFKLYAVDINGGPITLLEDSQLGIINLPAPAGCAVPVVQGPQKTN